MVQCNSLFKLFGSLLSRGGGACRTSIFHSLNKDQQPPTRHRANLSSPGHEKSAQLNKRATEWAPGARRNCRKRGHLSSKLPPDRCPSSLPPSLTPGFAGASPGLLNTKEPAARRRAKLGASRNPLSPWGRGSSLRPAVPSATAAFPLRVPPVGQDLRTEAELLTGPLRPVLGNSTRVPIFQ